MEEIKKKIQEDYIQAHILSTLYDAYDDLHRTEKCHYAWQVLTGQDDLTESIQKSQYARVLKEMLDSDMVEVEDLEDYGDELLFPYKELNGIL